MTTFKNFLLVCGTCYLVGWLHLPMALLWEMVSGWTSFSGDLGFMLAMPVITGMPLTMLAAGAGVAIARTVDAAVPSRWAALAGLLLFQSVIFRWRGWVTEPTTANYVAIAVEAVLPLLACIVAATMVEARRTARTR